MIPTLKGTDRVPDGMVYVCHACGKTSPTRYGFDEHNKNVADHGWDESCMLNCGLFLEKDLVRNKNGRVIAGRTRLSF